MGALLQGSEGSQHLGFGVGKRSLQWVLDRNVRQYGIVSGGWQGGQWGQEAAGVTG